MLVGSGRRGLKTRASICAARACHEGHEGREEPVHRALRASAPLYSPGLGATSLLGSGRVGTASHLIRLASCRLPRPAAGSSRSSQLTSCS